MLAGACGVGLAASSAAISIAGPSAQKNASAIPQARPALTRALKVDVFADCYWDRKELAEFCHEHSLSGSGSKADVTERIAEFLRSGRRLEPASKARVGQWDSDGKLTLKTPVQHYRNDARTRAFFQTHCGPAFRFNDYLRSFAKGMPEGKALTYGDLVEGWKQAEEERKSGKSRIGKQFEYNQFSRDYFAANPGGSRQDMMDAWAFARAHQGPNTYEFYQAAHNKKASQKK